MLRKVTIIQCPAGRQLSLEENLLVFKQRPDFVVFPEYYNVDPDRRDVRHNASQAATYLRYCQTLSDRLATVIIAGTAVEADKDGFFNTAHVFDRGRLIGKYRKANPTINERNHGIGAGSAPCLFELSGIRVSILICADVFQPERFSHLAEVDADIVFIPTTSPLRPDETIKEKFSRDARIFVAGAASSGSYLVKCCAIGCLWGGYLQGRSLVAAPWGILTRIPPYDEDKRRILSFTLDIAELREFRAKRHLQTSDKS